MLSVNAPVPGTVKRAVSDLRVHLNDTRSDHTLVVKRLGEADHGLATRKRVRQALAGQPTVEAALAGIDIFEEPASDTAPVVYLAVESPGLMALHKHLCDVVEPVPGIEGPDYVPHITIGRTTEEAAMERLRDREAPEIRWTVTELKFWDAKYEESVGRISLPS